MESPDSAERKWACVAVSNLIQNDPSTRRLLQGKNVVGALITRLSDSEEEVVCLAVERLSDALSGRDVVAFETLRRERVRDERRYSFRTNYHRSVYLLIPSSVALLRLRTHPSPDTCSTTRALGMHH